MKQSPAIPSSPLPKSFAGSRLIADVIINKYHYHQPLYRQAQQLKSHGLAVGDNTLSHWVMASAEQLSPLLQTLWSEVLKSGYLQVDETPVKVLAQKNKAYMWVYLNPIINLVIYDYQDTRRSHALNRRLSDYQGCLQSDGYAGYNELRQRQGILPYHYLHYLLTQVHALRRKTVNPLDLLPHRIDRDTLDNFAKNHQQQFQKALNLSQ